MPVKRMWLTSEESKVDALAATAEKYGMSTSAFAGLCAWMGYKMLMRTIEPENLFTPSQMVEMYMAAKAQGLDVVEPEEFKKVLEDAKNQ
jgi:hypothetical protein